MTLDYPNRNSPTHVLRIDNIKQVRTFKNFGNVLAYDGKSNTDIRMRIGTMKNALH